MLPRVSYFSICNAFPGILRHIILYHTFSSFSLDIRRLFSHYLCTSELFNENMKIYYTSMQNTKDKNQKHRFKFKLQHGPMNLLITVYIRYLRFDYVICFILQTFQCASATNYSKIRAFFTPYQQQALFQYPRKQLEPFEQIL